MDKHTAATIIQDFFSEIHYSEDTFELDIFNHIHSRVQTELYNRIDNSCKWEMLTEYDSEDDWKVYMTDGLIIDGPFNQCELFCNLRDDKLSIGRWQVNIIHGYNHLYICEFSLDILPPWLMWALNTRTNLTVASAAWKALLKVIKMLTMNMDSNPVNSGYDRFPIFDFYGIQFSDYTSHEYPDDNYINYEGNAFSFLRLRYLESRANNTLCKQ